MKKISFILITIIFILVQNPAVQAEEFNTCKTLYNDRKYNAASKCFYHRINLNSNDVQSRFWYAASLYFDRQYELSYAQYKYIANKYPNTNLGKYSLKEAQKVKARITHIQKARANDSGNYINELDRTSKWTQMPIRVWIEPCQYYTSAQKAFKEWQNKSGGTVRFVFVNNKNAAKISVTFVDSLNNSTSERNLGLTTLRFSGSKNTSAHIQILKRTESKQLKSTSQVYGVILHEIGHSLGMSGHSKNNNDIMFENDFTNDVHLSNRDINTLRAIYSKR